jgi:uncharacterized membrane protein
MTAMPIAVKSHCHWSIKSRSSPNVTAGRKGATQHNSSCVIAGAHTRDDGPNQLARTIRPSPRKPESSEVMYDYELTQTLTQLIKSRIPKTTIESLTDLIFGLALSIDSFSLLSKPPLSPADVIMELVGFGFSFLILISIWFRYTDIMSVLPVETGGTMFLNAVMLFLVSIEPYLLSLLTFGSFQTPGVAVLIFASEACALDLAGLTFIMGLFTHHRSQSKNEDWLNLNWWVNIGVSGMFSILQRPYSQLARFPLSGHGRLLVHQRASIFGMLFWFSYG